MSQRLSVSVVVCAYTEQRWHDLQRAIESLYAQRTPPDQIIVVSDYNHQLFARARNEFPLADVVENAGTKGLSGARNTGIDYAHGDVIAFLDDDAAAHDDWLDRIVEHYRDDSVTGVGGYINGMWPRARPRWLVPEYDWVVGCSYLGLPTTTKDVRNLIGANMSFRREVFAKIGGFSDSLGRVGVLPAGCEETELCIRARTEDASTRLVYDPTAIVDHYISTDRLHLSYFLARCYREGISKARVAQLSDTTKALENERTYVWSVLPRAAWRELRGGAPATALLVYVGVALACVGFVRGRLPRLR